MQRTFDGMAASDDSFDRWFREYCHDAHGHDLKAGFPPPEQALDFRS